jgi:hypothetical protein
VFKFTPSIWNKRRKSEVLRCIRILLHLFVTFLIWRFVCIAKKKYNLPRRNVYCQEKIKDCQGSQWSSCVSPQFMQPCSAGLSGAINHPVYAWIINSDRIQPHGGMRRLNTCTWCILRTCSSLFSRYYTTSKRSRVCRAKIKSRFAVLLQTAYLLSSKTGIGTILRYEIQYPKSATQESTSELGYNTDGWEWVLSHGQWQVGRKGRTRRRVPIIIDEAIRRLHPARKGVKRAGKGNCVRHKPWMETSLDSLRC